MKTRAQLEAYRRYVSNPSGKWCECRQPAVKWLGNGWACERCVRLQRLADEYEATGHYPRRRKLAPWQQDLNSKYVDSYKCFLP